MKKATKNPTRKNPTMSNAVPFTKASEKDRIKVTVSLKELEPYFSSPNYRSLSEMMKGTPIVVELPGPRKVLFEVNREGKTAATNAWPLIQPHVGKPVRYHVSSVTAANYE
jgi:hypothetical protein